MIFQRGNPRASLKDVVQTLPGLYKINYLGDLRKVKRDRMPRERRRRQFAGGGAYINGNKNHDESNRYKEKFLHQ
ncbi:MAG: hypothetical protein D6726_04410 [Nitrospirae bacterium]|nr:MAG: hypothetical protein D6726_04410 [Nitrospirota bacterium]